MLSKEDNEILTRVGPSTPMGELIRRYWMPALLCSEIPDRDGTRVRVRVLGENLVAFRDSRGAIGHSDVAVTAWRRRQLIKAAKALRDSGAPPPGSQGDVPHPLIRAEVLSLTENESWKVKSPLPDGLALETA